MDESQEMGTGQEESMQEGNESQATVTHAREDDRIESLSADLAFIKQKLMASDKPTVNTQSSEPEFTQADLERFRQDPTLIAKWLMSQTERAKNEIKKESQKEIWDRKAEEKFPLIKSDKEFQRKVAQQINELTSTGEYTRDNPMLVFRAAQLAAAEYQPRASAKNESRNFQTSAEPRTSNPRDTGAKFKVSEDDPRLRFALAAGFQGKQLERFKARLQELGPHQRTERKQGRRLYK